MKRSLYITILASILALAVYPAYAATEFVCNIASSGGDYTSLTTWEAAVKCDLTTAKVVAFKMKNGTLADGDEVQGNISTGSTATVVHCTSTHILLKNVSGSFLRGERLQKTGATTNYVASIDVLDSPIAVARITSASLSDSPLTFGAGWITSDANYIKVYSDMAAVHQGKWTDTAYTVSATNNSAITINVNHLRINGIQVYVTVNNGNGYKGFNVTGQTAASDIRIERCIVKAAVSAAKSSAAGIYVDDGDVVLRAYNNILYDFMNIDIAGNIGIDIEAGSSYILNNTCWGNFVGIKTVAGTTNTLKNNLVNQNGKTTDYSLAGTLTTSTNISEDETSPDDTFDSKAVSFADETGRNFHLAYTDTNALGAGTNLYSLTDIYEDVEGVNRPVTGSANGWDIGASELHLVWNGDTNPAFWQDGTHWLRSDGSANGAVPAANELVAFKSVNTNLCTVGSIADNIASITACPGYTGTVTFSYLCGNGGASATITISGDLAVKGGTVVNGCQNSTAPYDDTRTGNTFALTNVIVALGASLNSDGQGFAAGLGPGAPSSRTSYTAPSYGGRGNFNGCSTADYPTYGSRTNPVSLGTGGTKGGNGSVDLYRGGGALIIVASGSVINGGTISANGIFQDFSGLWYNSSAGSGGSLNITAASITGSGSYYARGTSISNGTGTQGSGGGRIRLNADTVRIAGTVSASCWGYWNGVGSCVQYYANGYSGTVYLDKQMNSSTGGELHIGVGASNENYIKTLELGSDDQSESGWTYDFDSLHVLANGELFIEGNPSLNYNAGTGKYEGTAAKIKADSVMIDSQGWLNADSGGWKLNYSGVGASIGYGGRLLGAQSPTYGSRADPISLGNIRAGFTSKGGGALILEIAGTLTVNGVLSSNGTSYYDGGHNAGSGGSINIKADVINGSGIIMADSGRSNKHWYSYWNNLGGDCGGGRIAFAKRSGGPDPKINFSGTVRALGGVLYKYGYPGTVSLASEWITTGTTFNVGTTGMTTNDNYIKSLVLGTDDEAADYEFHNLNILSDGSLVVGGNPGLNAINGTNTGTASRIKVNNDLSVAAGGSLNANGWGYGSGDDEYAAYPYATKTYAHGGEGTGNNNCYGSIANPVSLGANSTRYYAGGGAVILDVTGKLTNNGSIQANATGGTGGSVNITAGTLAKNCTGNIQANASATHTCGGGRIAINYGSVEDDAALSTFSSGGIQAYGSSGQNASAGTVYIKKTSESNGELTINNNNNSSATTTYAQILSPNVTTPASIKKLTVSGRGRASFKPAGGNAVTVTGDVDLQANCALVFDAGTAITLGVGGNFQTASTTTFTKGIGAVVLNGTGAQTLTLGTPASHTFYDLSVTNAGIAGVTFASDCTVTNSFTAVTPSTRLTFTGTKTYAFANPTINGQALGTKIAMSSSSSGSPWLFNYSGTQAIAYVSVSDSNATGSAATVTPTSGTSSDGLGNTNWNFGTSTDDRYWVGNGTSTSWNNTANWATTSGGSGGASVPGSGNTVMFDSRGSGDCVLDATPSVVSILNGGGYAGTLNGNTRSVTMSGMMVWKNGTLDLSTGTWRVSTGWDARGGIIIRGSSTVRANAACTVYPGANEYTNFAIYFSNDSGLVISGNVLVLRGDLTHNRGRLFNQIDLHGNYYVTSSSLKGGGSGSVRFVGDGLQTFSCVGTAPVIYVDKPSGTLDITTNIGVMGWVYVRGTVTGLDSRTLSFGDNINSVFTPGDITYGNISINKATRSNTVSGTAIVSGNLNLTAGAFTGGMFNVAGHVNVATGSTSTSPVTLDGSGDQTWTVQAGSVNPSGIIVSKSSGAVTITGGSCTLKDITVSDGTLSLAPGYTYTITAGNTITVASGATLRLMGTGSGDKVTMVSSTPGGTQWNLANVAGSLVTPLWVDVSDSNATNPVYATDSSSTGGNNVNWNFGSTGNRYWVASSDGVWSDPANWSTTSGGAGGASIPGTSDTAIFNSARSGNCSLDISPVITAITNAAGSAYAGTLNMGGYSLTLSGDLQWDGGTFTGGSGALSVTGNLTQAGGSFTTPSGGTTLKTNLTRTGGTFTNTGNTITFDNALSTQRSTVSMGGVLGGTVVINKTLGGNAPDYFTVESGTTINLGANPTTTLNANDCGIMNNGTIIIASGVWTLNGLGSNPAKLTNNGTITHSGNGWDLNSVRLTNTGTITYAGTGITMTGSFTQTGTFDLTGKTVTFDRTAVVVNDLAATVTANGSLGGTVVISRGTGGSNFIVANGTSINLGDNPTTELGSNGSGIINNGTIVVPSGTWAINNVGNVNAALFVNNGTITHSGNGFNLNGTSLTNEGTISYSGTSILISVNFIQNGTFDLAGKTITFYTSPLSTNATGSTISGSSHIGANIIVNKSNASHQMTLGSSVSIGGDFTLTRGTLNVYYDLTIAGNMSIASGNTVNLNQASPVQPVSLILGKGLSNSGTINVGSGGTDVNRSTIKSSSTAYITVTGGSVSANCDYCFFEYAAISGVTNSGAATVQAVTNDINGGGGDQGTTGAGGWNWGSCPSGKIWDGGGSTNNWSEAANWSGDTVPTGTDEVIFGSTSAKDCAINSLGSWSNGKVSIGAGYSGTVTLGVTAMTIGTFAQAGGTFTCGANNLNINGASNFSGGTFNGGSGTHVISASGGSNTFTLSGGTFNASSGNTTFRSTFTQTAGTFNDCDGTVIISPSGCNPTMDVPTSITFNNLTREAGYGVTISADGDTWIVDGALALNGTGAFSGGTIDANGSISIASTFGGGTTILLVNGAGDQSFTIPNGATLCGLTLNSVGTTVDFADGAIAGIGGSLTIQAGTFIASSGTTRFNGHSASFVHTVGGVFDHNDGTWIFGNLNSNNSFGSDVFNNVQFDFSYNSFTISSGPLTVNGTLTLTDATIYGGTIDAKGAVSMGPSFDGGTVAFSLTGTGTQAFTIASGAAMPTGTLTVNKDSDTATITGTTSAAKPMHNINVAKGTLTFGPGTYYIDDADVISVGTGASAAALNFTGTSPSNMVVLRSDTTAQWDLTKGANGTVNAQYVDVQYSAASAQVNAYDSINSGNNNANWIFPAATLSSWALDMNAKTLTLNFSNGVDSSSVLPGLFTLQNLSSSPTATYTLTDSSTSSVDGSTIVLDLTTTDFNAIVNTPGLCRQSDRSDSYLSMSAGVVDMATGAAVATVSGLQAASYTADTTVATKFRVITTGGAGQTTYTAGNGSGIGIKIRSYNDAGYRCPSYAADKTLVFSGASAAPKSQYIPTARDKTSSDIEFGSDTLVTFTYGEGASTLILYCKAPSGAPALIAATDSGNSVSTDPVYRLQVTVNPMTKSEVYFSQQPSATATINDPFAIQPVVTIRDMYGNRTDGDTDNITLYDSESDQTYSDAVGDISATSNPLAATDSTAAFSGVEFDTIGEVYLRAVASGLTPAFSTMITLFAGATSSVTVADSPTVNFNLIPTYDTLGERFAALKFKVTDTGDDAIATKIDRIKIAVGGTGASASTDIAWAGLYKGAVEVATATGAAITNSDITFGVTPNSNNTADLDSVADATATEYTLYIYMKSSKLTATDTQTYTFDTDSSLVGTDTGLSSQMKTQDDNNVAAVTGTVTVDVTHFEIVSQVTGNSSVTMSAGSTAELRLRAIDGNENVDIHYGVAPGEIKSLKFSGLASIGGNNPKIENTAFGSNINVEFVSGVSTAGAVTLTAYAREVADVSVLENGRAPALTVFPLTATVNALSGSALAYVSGNNQTGIINNNLSSSLVARVTDTYGNNVTGHTVSFEVFSYPDGATGYSVTPGSPVTDANGLAATTVRLGNVGGAYTVRASAVDGSMNPLAGSPVSFSATATQPTALVQMSGHVPQQSATVGQALSNPFVVKLQDSGNQGVPGETVSFSITSYPGGATGQSVSDPTDVTDGTGQASTTLTLGNKTGDYTVRATYTGVTPNLTADFTATATAGTTYKAVLTGPASVNAGTPSTAFTVSIKDQYDNPSTVTVTPMQFSLSTNPSLGTFYSDSGCTAGNEIVTISVAAGANTAVFYYKSNTVGTTDVTATTTDVRLNAGFRTSTVTAFSVIPADLHHFTVTATDMSTMTVAGSRTITIRAYDANNNLRTNYTDSMNIVFSGASASPSPTSQAATANGTAFGTNTSISFNAGVATAAFVPYKAETTLIKATFGVVTTADPDALSLNVRHGAVDHLKLHDNLTTPQTAGTQFSFDTTLDAVDQYDNICDGLNGATAYSDSNKTVTWTLSGLSDGPESGTDAITNPVSFNLGRSTTSLQATLYRAQDTTITADIAALPKVVPNRASNTITVNAADIQRMTFSPEPSDTCVTSQVLTQQPRVALVDQYGNACSNKSAQITLAGSTTTGTFTAVTNGAVTPAPNLVVSTSGGVATFSSLTYNYPEGIYLRAQAGSVTGGITLSDIYSRMITFSAADELATTVVAGASATVPSIANLQADKVEVLKFRITDGGTDGLAGVIKKIVINRDAGVDTTGGWLNYISDAYITDGTTQVLGSIDDDTLTFGTGSATIYSVSNNSLKNFTVSVNLKTSLPVGADGKVFSFKLTAASDITLGVPATSGLSAATITNSPTLTVTATKLVVTAVGSYTTMNAGVGKEILLRAKDVNNNIDLDFDDNKAITFGGASVATSGTKPTCTNYAGVAKDFGTGTDVTFLNGESSSTITMILYKAETAVVTATDSGGPTTSGADRLTVIVSGGSASQLSWYTQPKDHAVANAAWAPFVVAVTDAYGNTASDNREITVTPSAGVTLTTPLTNVATASSGLASFSGFAVYAGDDTYPKIVSLVASAAGVGDSVASANVTLEGKYTVTFNVKDSVNATALTGFRFSATDADTGDPVITETTKNSPFSLEGSDALPAGHYNFNFGKDLYVDLISEKTAGSAADGEDGVYDNAITWTIYMTTISEATADYKTMSSFVYDEDSETLNIRLWLERRGKMIVNSDINKIGTAVIEAYEPDGTALDTIVLPTKINEGNTAIDATFIKAVTGMLDADNEFGKALTAGKTYFVKCTINYGGTGGTANAYEAGTTFTVTVMQKMSQEIISKLGVGEGETLAGKIETVGAAVTIVSGKIDTIEGKIDGVSGQVTTVGSAVSGVSGQVSSVQSSASAILENVQTTLPAKVKTELEKGVMSEMLTRNTVMRVDDAVKIRYRTATGLAPKLTIYSPDGTAITDYDQVTMTEISTTGIYEYEVTATDAWGDGDFTVVCSEETKGSTDSMTITIKPLFVAGAGVEESIEAVGDAVTKVYTRQKSIEGILGSAADKRSQVTIFGRINTLTSTVDGLNLTTVSSDAKNARMNAQNIYSIIQSLTGSMGDIKAQAAAVKHLSSQLDDMRANLLRITKNLGTYQGGGGTTTIVTGSAEGGEGSGEGAGTGGGETEALKRATAAMEKKSAEEGVNKEDFNAMNNRIEELTALVKVLSRMVETTNNKPIVEGYFEQG